MKAITVLRRVRAAEEEISRMEQQKAQRWDVLTGISAPQADPNGGSRGTSDPDKNGRIMADIDSLERKIQHRREREEAEIVSGLSLLDMLPELESKVLHQYYLKRKTTTDIARKEKYTQGYVRRVKRQAEQALGMLSPERVAATLPGWYLAEEDEDGKGGDR